MGLALALRDGSVRLGLRDALRDSPFRLHALHLTSFLQGPDGIGLAAKAAAALKIPVNAFISMAETTPNLELVIPRTLDRTSWDGGAELDVTATTSALKARRDAERIFERGYDVNGNVTSVATLRYSARPYIILRPIELEFPTDPEHIRAAAPKHARSTVSTPSEERAAMRQRGREEVARQKAASETKASATMFGGSMRTYIPECDPETTPGGCSAGGGWSPPGVGGGGTTLPSEMTKSYCYGNTPALDATTDRDNDRIKDDCEDALAANLAPLLNIGNEDWCPARQPYWSASRHPDRPDNIQIIYALSYLCDGGYIVWGSGHEGDSEFIVLEVINAVDTRWGIISATLSAHFGAEEGVAPGDQSGADEYYWDDLDYPQGPFPRIWSALDKHSNYRNRAVCESGNWLQDSCHGDYIGTQIPAPAWRNLGNYYHLPAGARSSGTQLVDCTYWEGPVQMYGVGRTGEECFWREFNNPTFAGWDPMKPDTVTPYFRIFKIFGF